MCHLVPSTCPSPHSLCLSLSLSPSSSPSMLSPDTQAFFTSASIALLIDLHWPYSRIQKNMHTDTHNCISTCIHMHVHVHMSVVHVFFFYMLLLLFLLFCIEHAYILSDPVTHLKLSLGQLPSEASLLPQS